MAHSRWVLIITSLLLLGLLVFSTFFYQQHSLMLSMIFMMVTSIPFIIRFELRDIDGRELVILAVLAAIAAISRIPFGAIPSVQPTSFVIIVSAIVLGAESGFIIGATAALVSNLFLGQGPWTPWQMYAWGMMGLLAGILRNTWVMRSIWGRCIFGFVAGFLFSWLMNLWMVFQFGEFGVAEILSIYLTSFYFDLAHALSNVFFLAIFSTSWMKILQRFKTKYGLLS